MPHLKMENSKLLVYAAGIFVCYFYYGVLQERITRGKYGTGDDEETFTYSLSLVLSACIVNYAFAKILLSTVQNQGDDNTRPVYYASSALTYLLGMVSSNMALQWVNYPTQVVGKSCKPIPVMILGVLLGRKVYPLRKYLFVLLIVAGVALFIYKDHAGGGGKVQGDESWMGELLLVLSLAMDGLTGAVQERMRTDHKTKSTHMMLNMNFWSCLILGAAVLLTGEIWDFVHFIARHPDLVWQLATFSIAGCIGQFFIFLTVSEFGPLPCSIVTTTRKFFTVLGSVLFFGNSLLVRQWLGTILVFAGLFLDSLWGKSPAAIKK